VTRASFALVAISLACSNSGGSPDAGPPDLGFTPSNVVLGALDFGGVGDVIISANHTIQTDGGGMLPNDNAGAYHYTEVTQQSGPKLGVFTVKSLTIAAGATAVAQGADALVIVAINQITVQGNLYGNSQFQNGARIGPGAVDVADPNSVGQGLGGGGAATGDRSAGGGGFCGKGGGGATLLTNPALGGVTYGVAALTPLVVGSSGGDGALSESASGGAIQLVAGNSITVSGAIHVGGKGGGAGGTYMAGSSQEASGGGSGGAILLESQAITVSGILAANGAGGGQGNSGARGADATPDLIVAMSGNDGMSGSIGGNGSAGAVLNATAGQVAAATSAGGGGGGAGWIRLNTLSGMATMTGMLSPSITTPCATQGQVAP
jgi:hypothetical protein